MPAHNSGARNARPAAAAAPPLAPGGPSSRPARSQNGGTARAAAGSGAATARDGPRGRETGSCGRAARTGRGRVSARLEEPGPRPGRGEPVPPRRPASFRRAGPCGWRRSGAYGPRCREHTAGTRTREINVLLLHLMEA